VKCDLQHGEVPPPLREAELESGRVREEVDRFRNSGRLPRSRFEKGRFDEFTLV